MSDLAATLWKAFAVESAEHLAAIEPLLVGLSTPPGPGRAEEVGALFRAFHSLKGLARAMSRHGMEGVAHQAESLLGRVRDHGATVDDTMLDVLLEALDGLKLLRDAALFGAVDEPPPPDLIARLQRAIVAAGGAPDHAAPAPVPDPVAAAADPVATDAPAPGADSGLGDDTEMLGLFAELLQVRLPELAGLLTADESGREELADTLDSLVHGAGTMELDALAELFQAMLDALAAATLPLGEAPRAAMLAQLQDLAEKAGLLAEMLEVETGAAELGAALAAQAGPAGLAPGLSQALDALAAALATADPSVPALAQEAAGLVARSRQDGAEASRLMALLGDVCPRLAAGTLDAGPYLAEAIAAVALAGEEAVGEDYAAILAAGLSAALEQPAAVGEPVALRLAGPLVAALDPDQRVELAAALARGSRAYAVVLFLEDAPMVAGQLLNWLPGAGTMLTNRSVFMQGESWFEIMLVSETPPEALQAALLRLDPDRSCLRDLRELRDTGEVTIPLGPAAAPTPTQAAATATATAGAGELRVPGAVVERFMDAISETRSRLAALDDLMHGVTAEAEFAQLAQMAPGAAPLVERMRVRARGLSEQVERMGVQLRLLHAAALEVRIVPIDSALNRLPRVVRALAREQGKEVDLLLEGREVRVDKAIVDRLIEPLMHMVRNAIDHGIETPEVRETAGKPRRARLVIRAAAGAGSVSVLVEDDGRGLDRGRILARAVERGLVSAEEAPSLPADSVYRLVFAPGFSTAASLTETSGRGVGMDVVLTEVHRMGGEVTIQSVFGQGAGFTLRLPLTAATQAALLVRAGGQCLAFPERAVTLVTELPRADLVVLDGRPALGMTSEDVPVLGLHPLLWPDEPAVPLPDTACLIVVTHEGQSVALEVDEVLRRQELLLLRLHPMLAACPCVGGAAVLGSGEVALSLDVEAVLDAARAASWQVAPNQPLQGAA